MNVRYNKNEMEKISDKKRAIFESTLELIKENGFHGTPMSMVAKNAKVAAGTIYHYFESKDELILALYDYNKGRVTATIDLALAEDLPFEEKFFKVWRDLYTFYIDNPNVLIFFEQYMNSPYNTNKCPSYTKGVYYDLLQQGMEEGIIKRTRPDVLVICLVSNIHTLAKLHRFGKICLEETELNDFMNIIWKGLAVE